jgi:hypothetical protein
MRNSTIVKVALVGMTFLSALTVAQMKPQNRPTPNPSTPIVDDLIAAREATEIFLKGVKLADLPEGKEMLAGVQWITGEADNGKNFYVRPRFTEATTLFEKLFDTDVPSVQGYKRLLEMKAVSEAGTPLLVRYIMIAFKDQHTKQWKVLGTGTDDSVDIDRQVAFFGRRLQDTQFTSEQQNYLSYGHWLLLAGRISEARQALITALGASPYSNDRVLGRRMDTYSSLHRLQIQSLLTVIENVTGDHIAVSTRMT